MRKQTAIWKCKDGRLVRICDMEDRHLLNTIAMLERATQKRKMLLPYPMFQGEMAQMLAEQEFDRCMKMEPGDVFPIYDKLVADAERRGLINT